MAEATAAVLVEATAVAVFMEAVVSTVVPIPHPCTAVGEYPFGVDVATMAVAVLVLFFPP